MMLSVVIPIYNEVENVEELSYRIAKVMKGLKQNFELIYIVRGEDGTYEKLKHLKKQIPQIRIKYLPEPPGLGPAFKAGFNMISDKSTHVLTMDGDLNHQPEELPLFISKMKETNCDIVIGSRKIKDGSMINMPFYKRIISGFINISLKLLLRMGAKDLTSGYRLFKKRVILGIRDKLKSKNFEFCLEVLLISKKMGFTMEEVPIKFKYRIHGKSKLNFLTSGIGYARLLLRLMLH